MEHSVTGRPCSAAAKDLVGIGAALIDLHAAVAAGQAAHADAPGSPLRGDALDGNGQAGRRASGAADGQDALVLRVDVQQHTALQAAHIRAAAPSMPISSSTVNTASSGGCFSSLESSTASA